MPAVKTRGPRSVLVEDARIFDTVTREAKLREAWEKVRDNAGAGGGDGVTIARFQAVANVAIARLAERLVDGTYHPGPVRAVDVPKRSGGGVRRLSIPCVIDRVAQTAMAQALGPPLEAEFEDASFAYRPGRSVDQAVRRLQLLHAQGYQHVVDADIEGYFDAIPHDGLLARLGQSMSEGRSTDLIALWLTAAAPMGRGLAQGSPLSPLLANLYLDRLDEAFSRATARIVRFADDFVILTRGAEDAEAAAAQVAALLSEQGLRLNRQKTRVTDFDRSFRFLGHLFARSLVMKQGPDEAPDADMNALLAGVARRDAEAVQALDAARLEETDQIARGFSPGLRTLFVLEPGRRLTVRNQAFSVEEPMPHAGVGDWRELIAIPHQRIDRIDLGPEVEIDALALDHAADTATPVTWMSGHGATRAVFAPNLAPRAGRHLAQAAVALAPERRLELARILVDGRLRSQRNLLRKLLRNRDPAPAAATRAIAVLSRYIGHGGRGHVAHAKDVSTAMGYEGDAAAAYWPAVSSLCSPDFRFSARRRKQGAAAADVVLNFLAWMLHRDISSVVSQAGLHPGFGVLHAVSDRHDACVYDLMEEFRAPMIEGLLVYLANRRIITAEMFVAEERGLRLVSGAGASLVRAYQTRAGALVASRTGQHRVTYRRRMLEQAHALAAHVEARANYKPFELPF